MPSVRGEKINTEMRKELSVLIRELKDPRIPDMTSVVKAEVTKDLKFAKIYVSIMGSPEEKKNALKGLVSASAFLRREISHKLSLRATPELHFVLDDSIEHGTHILELIHEISKEKAHGDEHESDRQGN